MSGLIQKPFPRADIFQRNFLRGLRELDVPSPGGYAVPSQAAFICFYHSELLNLFLVLKNKLGRLWLKKIIIPCHTPSS